MLTVCQQGLVPIAAFPAAGGITKLNASLNHRLDAALTVSDANEILMQLYAYGELSTQPQCAGLTNEGAKGRKQRGIQDALGRAPNCAIPQGHTPVTAGTANQTKLAGRRVKEPLFDVAPSIDKYR